MWRSLTLLTLALIWSTAEARPVNTRSVSGKAGITQSAHKALALGSDLWLEARDDDREEESSEIAAVTFVFTLCPTTDEVAPPLRFLQIHHPASLHLTSLFLRGPPLAL